MLDLIFPIVCSICESVSKDGLVCGSCLRDIRLVKGLFTCLRCGVPFDLADVSKTYSYFPSEVSIHGHLCGRCLLGEFYFDKARSVAIYDGLLRDMLHKFKYHGKLIMGEVLSAILIENFPDDLDAPDLVIPVPLYIDRLRKREYNQSVIFGVNLSKYLGVPIDPFVLKRIRDTKPQFEIKSENEKKENVRGAFSIENFNKIKRKAVLLVDDIFTTGSTINECARVVLRAGASRVQALTLMRAVQS
jgi:ComF family protein